MLGAYIFSYGFPIPTLSRFLFAYQFIVHLLPIISLFPFILAIYNVFHFSDMDEVVERPAVSGNDVWVINED